MTRALHIYHTYVAHETLDLVRFFWGAVEKNTKIHKDSLHEVDQPIAGDQTYPIRFSLVQIDYFILRHQHNKILRIVKF